MLPLGGLEPLRWSKEANISVMDDAGIDSSVGLVEYARRAHGSNPLEIEGKKGRKQP